MVIKKHPMSKHNEQTGCGTGHVKLLMLQCGFCHKAGSNRIMNKKSCESCGSAEK